MLRHAAVGWTLTRTIKFQYVITKGSLITVEALITLSPHTSQWIPIVGMHHSYKPTLTPLSFFPPDLFQENRNSVSFVVDDAIYCLMLCPSWGEADMEGRIWEDLQSRFRYKDSAFEKWRWNDSTAKSDDLNLSLERKKRMDSHRLSSDLHVCLGTWPYRTKNAEQINKCQFLKIISSLILKYRH